MHTIIHACVRPSIVAVAGVIILIIEMAYVWMLDMRLQRRRPDLVPSVVRRPAGGGFQL